MRVDFLKPNEIKQNWIIIRKETINTEDSFIQLGPLTIDNSFYRVNEIMEDRALPNLQIPNAIFENILTLDETGN